LGSGDLTFSRSTTGYRIGASSLENELANVPRLSYRESSCPSLLLENARTNLLLRSDDLSNASWVKVNCTISSNAIAGPDGTTIADKIVDDTTNGAHLVRQNITKDNQIHGYTAYAFLKKGEKNWVRLMGWDASANGVSAWFDLR